MSVAAIKPTSPGRRGMVLVKQDNLYKGSPYKPLLEPKKQSAGRNNHGRITSWHRGGVTSAIIGWWIFFGTKTACRRKWSVWNMTPTVALIWLCSFMRTESADISLRPKGLAWATRWKAAIAPPFVPAMPNHCLAFRWGIKIHCVEMVPGKGAQLARAAGVSAQIVALDGDYAMLRLKSGEVRRVRASCRAVIGVIGHGEYFLRKIGKAVPCVGAAVARMWRAMVMNPVDHPMGGGEGRSKSNKIPRQSLGAAEQRISHAQ